MLRTQKANPLACADKHRNACQPATDKRKATQHPADKRWLAPPGLMVIAFAHCSVQFLPTKSPERHFWKTQKG